MSKTVFFDIDGTIWDDDMVIPESKDCKRTSWTESKKESSRYYLAVNASTAANRWLTNGQQE